MSKYLIINADDFGMCHAANTATFDLFEKGGITSATVMTPCGWAPEALDFAASHPEYAVGVHLTFTSEWRKYRWRPVSRGSCDSLRDKDGFMHLHSDMVEANAQEDEVEAEIRAQIEFALGMGLKPSHLDNHMGSLYGTHRIKSFLPVTLKICAEYGYAFRLMCKVEPGAPEIRADYVRSVSALADSLNVPIIDYLWAHKWDGEQSESYEQFEKYMLKRLENCPEGIVETYIHPSTESDELANTSSVWKRRVWEYNFFADPATRRHIEKQGIQLISYRDVYGLRGK